MIRQSILTAILSFSCFLNAQATISAAEIVAIKNSSSHTAKLEKTILVDAGDFKRLVSGLQIPFISVTQNILNFSTEDNVDIPEEALTLCTKAGVFRIWRNEAGIFACKLERRASLQQAYKLVNRETLARAQRIARCLLLVGADGNPHLSIIRPQ